MGLHRVGHDWSDLAAAADSWSALDPGILLEPWEGTFLGLWTWSYCWRFVTWGQSLFESEADSEERKWRGREGSWEPRPNGTRRADVTSWCCSDWLVSRLTAPIWIFPNNTQTWLCLKSHLPVLSAHRFFFFFFWSQFELGSICLDYRWTYHLGGFKFK